MRFIHISDLHLGKKINEFSMIEDQRFILEQVVSISVKQKANAVLIAGDIYDRQIPPAEAVGLFDWFLNELVSKDITVIAVSGNHDSAERIAFGADLMKKAGVYMSPVYDKKVQRVILNDELGEVNVYLLPFVRPASVRRALENENIESYQDAVKAAIDNMNIDTAKRNVLVAHQFVTGAQRCDSEDVVVGGLDNIDASVFEVFDYIALGHIHSPQNIGKKIRYCGTLLKYSVSEAKQKKTVSIIDIMEKGNVIVSTEEITPLHDLRKMCGTYMEVTSREFYKESNRQDYVQITLTDEEDIIDGMQKLRTIYPNLLSLEYDNTRTRQQQQIGTVETKINKTEEEIFEELYVKQNNKNMTDEQKEYMVRLFQLIGEMEEQY